MELAACPGFAARVNNDSARVAESVDARDSKSLIFRDIRVRVSSRVLVRSDEVALTDAFVGWKGDLRFEPGLARGNSKSNVNVESRRGAWEEVQVIAHAAAAWLSLTPCWNAEPGDHK